MTKAKEDAVLKDGQAGRTGSFAGLILNRVHTLNTGKSVPTKTEIPEPKTASEKSPLTEEQQIAQSQAMKEEIARMARLNQEHYLLCQMEDDNKKPWFMYPKFTHQYSEFVLIMPEMAQVMLDHLWAKDDGNRNKKPELIESYKSDILNNQWIPTDESIGINLAFEVYNGQHRLWAIVETGKAMPMYVTWNVLNEAKFFIESGAIRSLSERLKMVVDPKLGNKTSGFCKAIMRGVNPRTKFSNAAIAEFAYKWTSLLDWVSKHYPIGRAEVQAALAKAYLWYGPELIEPFCLRLREIKFEGTSDPARALYISLQQGKQKGIKTLSAYKKTLKAIDDLVNDKPVSKLHERHEDIFQWLPGWEVPPKPAK